MLWRVWFSAVGASQDPRRPWGVERPDGKRYLAASIETTMAKTAFLDSAFMDLPGGPRGILECVDVVMTDAVPLGDG